MDLNLLKIKIPANFTLKKMFYNNFAITFNLVLLISNNFSCHLPQVQKFVPQLRARSEKYGLQVCLCVALLVMCLPFLA